MTCYSACKAVAVMGFICLLLVNGSHQRGQTVVVRMEMAAKSSGIFREMEAVGGSGGRGKVVHPESHLNYMSKRRVPNGPDPIHNRRAGNSGRPPGKA